jgi:uncharacterized protein YuzE
MPEAREIQRNCAVCGDGIKINVAADGSYDNGYYFGIADVPTAEAGGYREIGISKIFGKQVKIYELTGKIEKYEYWECNLCFDAGERKVWLEERMVDWYDERCPDFDPTCGQCEAWRLFDKIIRDKSLRGNFEQEYDEKVDIARIYVKPKSKILPSEAAKTLELNDYINLSFDKENNLLGVKVRRASKQMPEVFRNKDLKEHVEKLEDAIQK